MSTCTMTARNDVETRNDALSINGLRALLRAWAKWRHAAHAWADCCPLGRARDARRSGVPAARLPTGVEMPRYVAEVAVVMDLATQAGGQVACNVGTVQAVYLASGEDYATIAQALGCSVATLKVRRCAGEMYLLGWLSRSAA